MGDFNNGYRHILAALTAEMKHRREHDDWIERERLAVVIAANEWAQARAITRRISMREAEMLEMRAIGHSDYASKYALHVAEWLYTPDRRSAL